MSMLASWKYVFASVAGTSHAASQIPCQDASACEVVTAADGTRVLLAAVSDGAGSAARADRGAQLVCASFIQRSRDLFAAGRSLHDLNDEFARGWLAGVQGKIFAEADEADLDPGDYSSTFLGAVIGENEATFLHLGDGAIVIARRASASPSQLYRCLSWPQQGEYVNSTHFVTDPDAADKIAFWYEAGVDEVAIFSDGIQHLVLDYEYQLAHAPFFNSLFSWLRASPEFADPDQAAGALSPAPGLVDSLQNYLNSPKVNERTDDDKTLILATRRLPDSNHWPLA